ncbi:starch synthase 3, chloroplastic/amyloplastic [Cornus florida]|uniref:starch synthase 3, chloroplastic/amyloplastic n=1 Tax=Cornus florida TaxID=4283 RepID=UPI00289F0D2A|nr:starch synthase 3, chloroplastic/amyloplastic [Cornus florida]
MEVSLQARRPVCPGTIFTQRPHLKIEPFLGFLPFRRTGHCSHSSSWHKDLPMVGASYPITASADFSKKRQRKIINPGPKGSAPKGFVPKTQGGTSTQKRSQSNDGAKGPSTPTSSEYAGPNKATLEMKTDSDEEHSVGVDQAKQVQEESVDEIDGKVQELSSIENPTSVSKIQQFTENGRLDTVNEDAKESQIMETVVKKVGDRVESTDLEGKHLDVTKSNDVKENESMGINELQKTKPVVRSDVEGAVDRTGLEGKPLDVIKSDDVRQNRSVEIDEAITKNQSVKRKSMEENDMLVVEERDKQDSSLKLKLELEANIRKQVVERLSEENFLKGNKLFYYPELVKPDQDVEVFLNRSLSTLSNELDVMIMGAFNDWRWKSFTTRLNKTHLQGDWWSCQVHVPREAYKMDFVFFNGKDIYDNNDKKDFCINVEGGMDVFQFDDFLLEEKRRELEKLAKEQAEREKQAEEQRRIEAEKAASEVDRAQAREETERRRGILRESMKKAVTSVDNVWYIKPSEFKGDDIVRLYYNRSSGPLAHAKDLWIHGGYNNWNDGLSIISRLVSSERQDGDWWYADVIVPGRAFVLDWVFADGPPQHATLYDNNNRQDFHGIVPKCIPEELYWVEEEHQIYRKLQKERRLREEAIRAKAERTALMKAEMKERTLKAFLLSQKHVVYTEPLDVRAGSTVTVFYNPANTILNGRSEIWFRCSFNRWTHRRGPLPPQKMIPADNSSHVKTPVKVPLDAYMMDFVFSEREDGGIFDNKNGMDYHIPVFGGVMKEPPMHIVHISVEMAPIAKVGGLGDVVTSLSRAIQDLNHTVDIILPKYDCLNFNNVKDFQFHKSYSWGGTEIKVWLGKVEGLSVYFLEPQNRFFWAGCIYGCKNDGERFGFFCHAALEFLLQSGFHPDIIHCHDWSSAPVAWLFKDHYMHYGLSKARVVFTIHNLEFGANLIGRAMKYADKATTVSHTYSKEVSGNPVIAPHLHKFHGILNGIDLDIWDPYNDKFIPTPYTSENVVDGKKAAKEALQQRLGLKRADLPLVGIITRLTHQKGIHLIKHAIWRTLDRNGQVVLLGSAPDPRIQNDFVNLANQLHSSHGDRARLCLTYDEPLSHLIYAGADFILVPSIFEPCGLTQLTAMRYGSVPVVRKTGGLYDTVFDVDHDKERAEAQGLEPNGFNFEGADTAGVDYALDRAISAWYDGRDWFNSICKRVMDQDWSWNRPALEYLELYHAACK